MHPTRNRFHQYETFPPTRYLDTPSPFSPPRVYIPQHSLYFSLRRRGRVIEEGVSPWVVVLSSQRGLCRLVLGGVTPRTTSRTRQASNEYLLCWFGQKVQSPCYLFSKVLRVTHDPFRLFGCPSRLYHGTITFQPSVPSRVLPWGSPELLGPYRKSFFVVNSTLKFLLNPNHPTSSPSPA